jgi:hypothetical protein
VAYRVPLSGAKLAAPRTGAGKENVMRVTWCLIVALLAIVVGCGPSYDYATPETPEASAGGEVGAARPMEPAAPPMADADREITRGQLSREEISLVPGSGGDEVDGRPAPQAQSNVPLPAPPQPTPVPAPTVAGAPVGAMLIYMATLHLAVHEPLKTIDRVQRTALDLGGYLVRRDQQSITVRVPADKYKTAMAAISALGDVVHREETVEDVTDQYFDLTARLRNARALRDRLEELLKQAKDVNEALAVQRELGKVNADIESMETKLKTLRELVAFSTITVQTRAPESDRVGSSVKLPFAWLSELGLPNLLSL